MQIDKKEENGRVTLVINGELDAETSPDLEKELSSMEGVTDLTLDLCGVEYMSSAGLRVLMLAKEMVGETGKLALVNVQAEVKDVMDMTGTSELLGL